MKVAKTEELKPGQVRLVEAKGKEIALFNVDGEFFALDNACTHEQGPLCEGEVEGHKVTCPLHGAMFDIRTGEVLGVASAPLARTRPTAGSSTGAPPRESSCLCFHSLSRWHPKIVTAPVLLGFGRAGHQHNLPRPPPHAAGSSSVTARLSPGVEAELAVGPDARLQVAGPRA